MKSRTATGIGLGVSLSIVILTVVLDIFPYFVIGVIGLILAATLFVDALREYFRRPTQPPPVAPPNWNALKREQLPLASEEACKDAKQHLAESCEVHGKHVSRAGAYGLIEHPLSLDE